VGFEDIAGLERRIKRVESTLVLLSIAAIASGDFLFGPDISLGYLYLIPLSYSALTHRWPVTVGLTALCVVLRQSFGPLERASWALIARDWVLTAVFLSVVLALHRLGRSRAAFFETARRQRDELLSEVEMAAAVQKHLLEQHLPPAGPLDVVARTKPARGVGGDYYDFIPLDEGRFGIVVADVAGKGLPAALLMPAVKIALRTLAARHSRIADILVELNGILLDNLHPASYITLFYGAFDARAGRVVCANAGHTPALHLRARTGEATWLTTGGAAVGLIPSVEYETSEIEFEPGDVFVFYTDGITEAENAAGTDFGRERLLSVVREAGAAKAATLVGAIHAAVEGFRGPGSPVDDATVIAVRVPGSPA
jgi:sigma-B regulation protein RsbU (phosphoserine phosphatase)